MTATLTHRRAALPSAGTPPHLVVHVTMRDELSPRLADLLEALRYPSAPETLDREHERFMTAHLAAASDIGCIVASLPEISADVSAQLRDELDQVEVETDLMTWAALAPGVTWHDVAAVASSGLAHLGLADDTGRARLLAGVLALLRGWLIRTTGKAGAL